MLFLYDSLERYPGMYLQSRRRTSEIDLTQDDLTCLDLAIEVSITPNPRPCMLHRRSKGILHNFISEHGSIWIAHLRNLLSWQLVTRSPSTRWPSSDALRSRPRETTPLKLAVPGDSDSDTILDHIPHRKELS